MNETVNVEMTPRQMALVYKYLRSCWVQPDEQAEVYSFIRMLDQYVECIKLTMTDEQKRDLD